MTEIPTMPQTENRMIQMKPKVSHEPATATVIPRAEAAACKLGANPTKFDSDDEWMKSDLEDII